ncbi:MAG: hypothetical protein R3F59_19150 [Myxococcota bacterium]
MTFHKDLLDHAKELVPDAGRPRRVLLVRAISTAYYSVFHLLIANATRRVDDLQPEVSRWFGHDRMKAVCGWFGSRGEVHKKVAPLLAYPRPGRVPPELSELADIFVDLQEARHRADYDLGYRPSKQDVSNLIESAEHAHDRSVARWEPNVRALRPVASHRRGCHHQPVSGHLTV